MCSEEQTYGREMAATLRLADVPTFISDAKPDAKIAIGSTSTSAVGPRSTMREGLLAALKWRRDQFAHWLSL